MAQIPSLCHLCESNQNIQWKCLDCDLLMCTNCKEKIHTKFKSSSEHSITAINVLEPKDSSTAFQTELCEKHRNQSYTLHCSTCNVLVCVECITTSHRKHDFEQLSIVYNAKVDELKYYKQSVENEVLPSLVKYMDIKEKENSDKAKMFNIAQESVLKHQYEMKRIVDEQAERLLKKLENNWKEQEEIHTAIQQRNQKSQKNLRSINRECEIALKSKSLQEVIKLPAKIDKAVRESKGTETSRIAGLQFVKGNITKSDVADILGNLNIVPDTKLSFSLEKSLVYDSNSNSILALSINSTDSAWFLDNAKNTKSKLLTEVKLENKIKIVQQFNHIDASTISLMSCGELLLSVAQESSIKRLTRTGQIEMIIEITPFLAKSLHVSKTNMIIVGMRERGPAFPVTKESIRQIIVYDIGGKIQMKLRYDENGQNLFSVPIEVTSNINGDICVIDRIADDISGRVLVLGLFGEVQWSYYGNNDKNEFYPSCITTTSSGKIICSDYKLNSLHVLNISGQLLMIQNTKDMGFEYPYSLGIDPKGFLWVGCTTTQKKQKAKLMILKCLGF